MMNRAILRKNYTGLDEMRTQQGTSGRFVSLRVEKTPAVFMIQTVHIVMSYSVLLWRNIFSGVPAMGTRPSGLEERDGEICLQRKWAALRINGKAAIPVPRATQNPGNSQRYQNSSVKRATRRITGKRAAGFWSGCFPCRRTLLATMAAINAGCVEGNVVVDMPSGLKCAWYNLTHPAQFAILLLMVGLVSFVNRLFNEADKVMYTRLSRATDAWMDEMRHTRRGHQPVAT
ncbi:unnamed protein product [Ectocarpus sp. CCAP 1310/34]|nr:unnamed protein product [Ectocarpus sp. CCAP 1310/34]